MSCRRRYRVRVTLNPSATMGFSGFLLHGLGNWLLLGEAIVHATL